MLQMQLQQGGVDMPTQNYLRLAIYFGLFFQILVFSPSASFSQSLKTPLRITPEKAAFYIHAVIAADRTIYSQYLVDRLKETIDLDATENWKEDKTLLLPAQFLMMSSKIVNSRNLGLNFRLMSLWPINKANGPKNNYEQKGLEEVLKTPEQPYTWIQKTQGQNRFHAIYPDKAVTRGCVTCHNAHPKSSKRNFKRNDVMGGIEISFPISSHKSGNDQDGFHVAPEVVTDYIHAILEADRTVYAKHVVNRLQKKKVIYPSENWWEENTLLLPAQFLLNASDLIKNLRLGLDYRLISLWPINPHNGAANQFERIGLESVVSTPLRPYIGTTQVGNKKYFQAVYPDLAVTQSCVTCHNAHPNSPKHDFKLYDVMGGIVVSIPLDHE